MSRSEVQEKWYLVIYLTTKKPADPLNYTLKDLFPGEDDKFSDYIVFEDKTLETIIKGTRSQAIREFAERVEEKLIAENTSDVNKGLVAYDSSLLGTPQQAYNQALKDVRTTLQRLVEEETKV